MKIVLTLVSVVFLFGCASSISNKEMKKTESKGSKSTSQELQDVKTVDKTYSQNIKTNSSLKKIKSRVACADHQKVDKKNWRDLLEAGFSCVQDKKWTELSSIAGRLSHSHLKAPWGPYYRSIVAENRGDLARALWMVDLALKKSPENSLILYQKARVLWLSKKESQSYAMMKKVIDLDPKNYDALLFLGNIHYRDRDFEMALKYYKKVLEFNHRDAEYRAAMGESLFFTGKDQESLKHYKSAAAGVKMNASLYYKIGLVYKNLKNWSMSKNFLEKAISQKRKGRSLASLGDVQIRADLKSVVAKINAKKTETKAKEKK